MVLVGSTGLGLLVLQEMASSSSMLSCSHIATSLPAFSAPQQHIIALFAHELVSRMAACCYILLLCLPDELVYVHVHQLKHQRQPSSWLII